MAMTGKCPGCGKIPAELIAELITVKVPDQPFKYRGTNFLCCECNTILGSGIDPMAMKKDILDKLLKAIGSKRAESEN